MEIWLVVENTTHKYTYKLSYLSSELNRFNPNLNNSKTSRPINDVDSDLMHSLDGKFRNKKFYGSK